MPQLETALTERLGVTAPLVQAPIGSASCPELAAAVASVGGLGMLAITWRDEASTRAAIAETRRRTDGVFGVNIVVDPEAKAIPTETHVEICQETGVEVVSFSFGDAEPYIDEIHDYGGTVLQTVGSAEEATAAVEAGVEDALAGFESGGTTVETISVDHGLSMDELGEAVGTTFTAAMADTATVLKEQTGVDLTAHPDDVSNSLLAMIEAGRGCETSDLALSGLVRTELFDAIQSVFESYDLLVTPTIARPGFGRHEDLGVDEWDAALTWPFNITGHPAASVPVGCTEAGYPVGLQVVGRRYADDTVLAASAALETISGEFGTG